MDKNGVPQRSVNINFRNPTTFATIGGVYAYFGKFVLSDVHLISNGTAKDFSKLVEKFTRFDLMGKKLTCEIVYKDLSIPFCYSELTIPISGTMISKDKVDNRENVNIKKPKVDKELVKLLVTFCNLLSKGSNDRGSRDSVGSMDSLPDTHKRYNKTPRKTSKSKIIYTYKDRDYVRVLDKTINKYIYVRHN